MSVDIREFSFQDLCTLIFVSVQMQVKYIKNKLLKKVSLPQVVTLENVFENKRSMKMF